MLSEEVYTVELDTKFAVVVSVCTVRRQTIEYNVQPKIIFYLFSRKTLLILSITSA